MINKVRSTHKELISNYSRLTTKALGFTMAEILLSLTIIGVVAAITLPSLTGNINERTWNTQRKALYARFSQAIALMPALNGYGTLDDTDSKNVAETFITNGLSKVLKINNICSNGDLKDCGIPDAIVPLKTGGKIQVSSISTLVGLNEMFNGSYAWSDSDLSYSYSQTDTKAAAFETANGESILAYYNPRCINFQNVLKNNYLQPTLCANFIYDLNGRKGPNTFGKDIGIVSVFYPSDSVVVAPMPLIQDFSSSSRFKHVEALSKCHEQDEESRLPNKNELAAIFVNQKFFGLKGAYYWSSELNDSRTAYAVNLYGGFVSPYNRDNIFRIRCVKR